MTLKRYRLARGLTQADVASRVKVATSSYSAWESGRGRPAAENFPKLAQVLSVPVEELTYIFVPLQPGEHAPISKDAR